MGEAKYDVALIGAGIVGLAVAREVLQRRPGTTIVVIERESDVARHQTGHNSGVIHGGIYYEPGSLKAKLCVEGAARMYEYAEHHKIAHQRCGKLVVAVRDNELPRLDELERRGVANRVPGIRRVSAEEIGDIEPNATGIGALHAPNTGIIDYAAVARTIRRELEDQGVDFLFDTDVQRVEYGTECRLLANGMITRAAQTIVCAGLWSDRLARRSGAPAQPRIVPFRGVYLRLKPNLEALVNGMVYPVPLREHDRIIRIDQQAVQDMRPEDAAAQLQDREVRGAQDEEQSGRARGVVHRRPVPALRRRRPGLRRTWQGLQAQRSSVA